jgi:Transcriptional regulators of sugar metabolism
MTKEDRHKLILREINLHNKVLSVDLSNLLNVSDDTIRRDLKELAEAGKVLKVHGGAQHPSFRSSFDSRNTIYALNEKQVIAQKTTGLFKNEMNILTEGGTTITEMAKKIPAHLHATFFTVSPQVAIILSESSNLHVIGIGGTLNKNAYMHVGASVINQLNEIRVDLCVIGANAFSVEAGLSDSDWEVVQVLKAMIRCAKKVAVVTISEKLNTIQRLKVCDLNSIHYLVTELPREDPRLNPYREQNITII